MRQYVHSRRPSRPSLAAPLHPVLRSEVPYPAVLREQLNSADDLPGANLADIWPERIGHEGHQEGQETAFSKGPCAVESGAPVVSKNNKITLLLDGKERFSEELVMRGQ